MSVICPSSDWKQSGNIILYDEKGIFFSHFDKSLGFWTSVHILCTERLLPACIAVIQAKRAWVSSSNHRRSLCFFFPFHRRFAIVTSVAKDLTTPATPHSYRHPRFRTIWAAWLQLFSLAATAAVSRRLCAVKCVHEGFIFALKRQGWSSHHGYCPSSPNCNFPSFSSAHRALFYHWAPTGGPLITDPIHTNASSLLC